MGAGSPLALLTAWLASAARATLLYPRRLRREGRPRRRGATGPPNGPRSWRSRRGGHVRAPLGHRLDLVRARPVRVALLAAGFVAGGGPLGEETAPARPRIPGATAPRVSSPPPGWLRPRLLVAWAIWQPEASDRAVDQAVRLASEGRYAEALAKADDAADADPLSPDPALHPRGRADLRLLGLTDAERSLEQAVLSFPGDPQHVAAAHAAPSCPLDRPRQANLIVSGALYLDPYSTEARTLYISARSGIRRAEAGRPQP